MSLLSLDPEDIYYDTSSSVIRDASLSKAAAPAASFDSIPFLPSPPHDFASSFSFAVAVVRSGSASFAYLSTSSVCKRRLKTVRVASPNERVNVQSESPSTRRKKSLPQYMYNHTLSPLVQDPLDRINAVLYDSTSSIRPSPRMMQMSTNSSPSPD